jgi:uncharacterized protein Veg
MKKIARVSIVLICMVCYSNIKAIKTFSIKPIYKPYRVIAQHFFKTAHLVVEELPEFNVTLEKDKVHIKWVSEKMSGISEFIIEKSNDGKKFKKLTDIKCSSSTIDQSEYFETDYHPAMCYRIKQLSGNRDYKYSQTVFVKSEHGRSKHKENAGAILSVDTQTPILIIVHNKQGEEYTSKVFISVTDGKITGIDENKLIPPGDYFIVASKLEAIDKQNIEIK